MTPVAAAVIDRAIAWARHGTPAPASRLEGSGLDLDANGTPDAIAFPYANGGVTTALPAVDDSSLDTYDGFQVDTAFDSVTGRYLEVLGALAHEPSALSLPGVACRLGGFAITEAFSDSALVPFADMSAHWKNFGDYNACLTQAVAELATTGLYDPAFAPSAAGANSFFE